MSNLPPFLLICLLIITVVSSLSVLNVNAQTENKSGQLDQTPTNETVGWQTYEDDENGYKIQYPQEWKTYESPFGLPQSQSGFAKSPDDDNTEPLMRTLVSVHVDNASRTLDPATLKVQPLSPEQNANELIAGMTSAKGTPNILRNEAITFGGQPAWRVDYIHNYLGVQANYGISIFVVKDQKIYEISLLTAPLKVEEMRPVGEKIIQTFQFTNNTAKN